MINIAASLMLLFVTSAHGLPIPDGWCEPDSSITHQEWRTESENKYLSVSGDFDGDGLTDTARILVSDDREAYGLLVFMASREGAPEVYTLFRDVSVEYLGNMGIETVGPGRYETACGKGYWECGENEPEVLMLSTDAINYFQAESANSFFVWNPNTNNFDRIWISD